jgi:hypothetical protein
MNNNDIEILAAYTEVRNKVRERQRKKNECKYCGKNKNWCVC